MDNSGQLDAAAGAGELFDSDDFDSEDFFSEEDEDDEPLSLLDFSGFDSLDFSLFEEPLAARLSVR